MSAKIDAFLAEVRNRPGFVAASASDSAWLEQLEGLERALIAIERKADDDSQMVDILDSIETTIGRRDLSTKERLLEVGKLLVRARDAIKFTH